MSPPGPKKQIPMILASTRRWILDSRSRSAWYRRAFSSDVAASEARNFRIATRAGVNTRGARLFSRYSRATSLPCLISGSDRTDRAGLRRMYSSSLNASLAEASSRMRFSCVRAVYKMSDSGISEREIGSSRRSILTESSLVLASARTRSSGPCGISSSPRSAPACSRAIRNSVSMSLSSTISPDTASDTLRTVARSK